MSLIEFSQVLYDSEFGTALRESVYAFPIVEGLHLISLAFSVGLILFVDLRLTGLFLRNVPVADILKPLRPWLLTGFVVTISTGIALFIAEASKVIVISVFPLKILFILLAGINAIWFEHKWGRNSAEWGNLAAIPKGVKFAGLASITLWSGVVITGRLIPYFGYQ
ncbi:MAG TPA: DUF6644 family protein [Methylotenera sp.]|jgi:hypothetical protein|nr:DUF6644 family protein [Methylotenera sp.]